MVAVAVRVVAGRAAKTVMVVTVFSAEACTETRGIATGREMAAGSGRPVSTTFADDRW